MIRDPKNRISLRLVLLVAVLTLIGVAGIWWQQTRQNEQRMEELVAAIEGSIASSWDRQAEILRAASLGIQQIDSIKHAYLARDRGALLRLSAPIFAELRSGSGITHFYFHTPDQINFLRVHQPDLHGERIERVLFKRVVESGQSASGLEAGPMGTLAMRLITPWRDAGMVIGYLELGMDIDPPLEVVRGAFPVALHLFMAKKDQPSLADIDHIAALFSWEWQSYSENLLIHHDSPRPAGWLRPLAGQFLDPGKRVWFEISLNDDHFNLARLPLRNIDGEEIAFLLVVWEITESTHRTQGLIFAGIVAGILGALLLLRMFGRLVARLEAKLRVAGQREELLGHMLDGSVHPILLFEWPDLTIRQANQGAIDSLGYDAESLQGVRISDLVDIADRGVLAERLTPLREGQAEQTGLELHLRTRSGEKFPVDMHLQRFEIAAISLGVAMIQEISARKMLEEERLRFERDLLVANAVLFDHQTSLRMIFEHALEGIVTIDAKGLVVDVNPAAEAMFGFTREQFLGNDLAELIIPPELRAAHRAALARLERVSDEEFRVRKKVELLGLRADGRLLDLELGMSAIYLKGQRHFTAIMHDITERKQLLRSLRETLDVAESVHRMKSEFLANMSHEIRTPMNAIIGMTDLLLGTRADPEEQRRHLETIQQSSESLLELINGILDLSKIDAGMIALERVTFDLSGQLEKAVETLAVKAHRKELELYCAIDDDVPPTLVGDPLRLRQVVLHLLSNAIKFTESGEVVLRVSLTHDVPARRANTVMVRFSVRDTGEGIPLDKQALIFERFTQLDGSATRRHGGTGLGLAICKPLISLMDGEIGLESMPGVGSTFYFTARFGVTQRFRPGEDGAEADERRASEYLGTLLAATRVILADRRETGRLIVGDLLRAAGARVEVVESSGALRARLAGRAAPDSVIDLVVLDHGVLQGDSVDLDELDRYASEGGKVVLLVPTTLRQQDLSFLDWLHGVTTLRKPVWKFRLLKAVRTALGRERQIVSDQTISHGREEKSGITLEILLVEDQEASGKVAELLLEQAGHAVRRAHRGAEALERLRSERFDLLLMNLELPEMDGLEAVRRIRASGLSEEGSDCRVPIIAVTLQASMEEEKRCLEVGVDGYLAKPYRESELLGVIERVIKRRKIFKCRPEPKNAGAVLRHMEMSDADFVTKGGFFVEQVPSCLVELRRAVQDRNGAGIVRPLQWLGDAAREVGAWKVPIQGMRLRGGVEQNRWEEAVESLVKLEGLCTEALTTIGEKLTAMRDGEG
ncbi:MAG: PAS domain S-box protein [Magnetococcales bacterium]|nr:PAS domain S-box protein [Magnetococcales bacterium]